MLRTRFGKVAARTARNLPKRIRRLQNELYLVPRMREQGMILRHFITAVVSALVATPAIAQQEAVPPSLPSISTYCATIRPGNPYSPAYDYQAYMAFRSTGNWDNRGSDACARDPRYSPPGTSPFRPDPYPRPSWF
jgi:hypothetical protein